MKRVKNNYMAYMKSLVFCLNKIVEDGYTAHFSINDQGILDDATQKQYTAEQVKVITFFQFEGRDHPGENAVLYVLETIDGMKGTLVDAFERFTDSLANRFILHVQKLAHSRTS